MRVINEPIKVMTIFDKDGTIEPVKFRYEDQVVWVEKIIRIIKDIALSYGKIIFVCQTGNDLYELKYDTVGQLWYLYKK